MISSKKKILLLWQCHQPSISNVDELDITEKKFYACLQECDQVGWTLASNFLCVWRNPQFLDVYHQ